MIRSTPGEQALDRLLLVPTGSPSLPGMFATPAAAAALALGQDAVPHRADFLGHAGVGELAFMMRQPSADAGLSVAVLTCLRVELGAEVLAGLADHAAYHLAEGLGLVLGGRRRVRWSRTMASSMHSARAASRRRLEVFL